MDKRVSSKPYDYASVVAGICNTAGKGMISFLYATVKAKNTAGQEKGC